MGQHRARELPNPQIFKCVHCLNDHIQRPGGKRRQPRLVTCDSFLSLPVLPQHRAGWGRGGSLPMPTEGPQRAPSSQENRSTSTSVCMSWKCSLPPCCLLSAVDKTDEALATEFPSVKGKQAVIKLRYKPLPTGVYLPPYTHYPVSYST